MWCPWTRYELWPRNALQCTGLTLSFSGNCIPQILKVHFSDFLARCISEILSYRHLSQCPWAEDDPEMHWWSDLGQGLMASTAAYSLHPAPSIINRLTSSLLNNDNINSNNNSHVVTQTSAWFINSLTKVALLQQQRRRCILTLPNKGNPDLVVPQLANWRQQF